MAEGVLQNSSVFATIEGTFGPNSSTVFLEYPTGFNSNNTKIISLEVYLNGIWRNGVVPGGIVNNNVETTQTVALVNSTKIGLNNSNPNLYNIPCRVTLMHY